MEVWESKAGVSIEWGEGGASEAFANAISEMVNHKQVYDMLETQSQVYPPPKHVKGYIVKIHLLLQVQIAQGVAGITDGLQRLLVYPLPQHTPVS
jgi:hypothetical protein